jgi:peptide/nickel transport system permease protein
VSVASSTELLSVAGPSASSTERLRWLRRGMLRSWRMSIGLAIIALFVLVAIFGPMFTHDPNAFVGPQLAGPSARFWLGTTQSGQSVFAQLIASTQATLLVGFAAGLLATIVAIAVGIGGAFAGGLSDELLNLMTNVVLVIPVLPLIIIVSAYLKSGGLAPTILVIAVTGWAGGARVLRGLTLSMRNRDYVHAARVSGERTWRIVVVEILPNLLAFIVSSFIFSVIFAILTQAGLAFIGLESPNTLTWGNMLYFAQNDEALSSGAWWWFVPPGLCIALLGTGLALVNFGLDEVLNPRLRIPKAAKS